MTSDPDLTLADSAIARVLELIEARTWRQKYRCIERGPVVRDHLVASQLATLRAESGEPLQAAVLESYARLLKRCADLGGETALAETAFRVTALHEPTLDALARGAYDRWTTYVRDGDAAAIDSLIADYSALNSHPAVCAEHPAFRLAITAMLGHAYLARFLLRRSPGDLEQALELLSACTGKRPTRWFVPPPYHAALARALDERYGWSRSLAHLEAAIAAGERAVRASDPRSRFVSAYLSNLGLAYQELARRTRSGRNIDRAVNVHRASVVSSAEPNAGRLTNLAYALTDRYRHNGTVRDLNEAVRLNESARAILDSGSGNAVLRMTVQHNLAVTLIERHSVTGSGRDLDTAIGTLEPIATSAPTAADRARAQDDLGDALRRRYLARGDRVDLDRALDLGHAAVEAGDGDREAARHCNNLASTLLARFAADGRLADLDEAIAMRRQALQWEDRASRWWLHYQNNLAHALILRYRYQNRGDPADLREAVEGHEIALRCVPADSPARLGYAANLAAALRDRYRRLQRVADLDRALELLLPVVAATRADSTAAPARQHNLGAALLMRYRHTRQRSNLNDAVTALRAAVGLTPRASPDRAIYLTTLASALREVHAASGTAEELAAAVRAYREATRTGLRSATEVALSAGTWWAEWAAERGAWAESVSAYRHALRAARRILLTQAFRSEKETVLARIGGLAAEAATAFVMRGHLREAVVTLETGRAITLAEALDRDRVDLDGLVSVGRSDLRHRYLQAAAHLRTLEAAALFPETLIGLVTSQQIEAARIALDEAIAEIRRVDGYSRFLALPTWDRVIEVAREAPVVYLSAATRTGHALIVDGSRVHRQVAHVRLPKLTTARLDRHAKAYRQAMERRNKDAGRWASVLAGTTRWLWRAAMGPLDRRLPQGQAVTLVPRGLLALLPLHAAWTWTRGGPRYALDSRLLVYAPNAQVLDVARRTAAPADALLAVEGPDVTYGHPVVHAACAMFVRALPLSQPSRARALDEIAQHTVHHFDCHGMANPERPLDSALRLGTEALTVRDVLAMHLDSVQLAILSACSSAVIGVRVPSEVVSFPTALMQAGWSAVIGTLWPVWQYSTALLMLRFYVRWRIDRLEAAEALRDAQRWLRDSTIAEKREFMKVAATIEALREAVGSLAKALADPDIDPAARDDQELRAWAGFMYVGHRLA